MPVKSTECKEEYENCIHLLVAGTRSGHWCRSTNPLSPPICLVCCVPGSQPVDSSGGSALGKARPATVKTEHTLSDFMNAKIEMTIRQEEKEARQHSARGDDCAYPAQSSSGSRLQVPGQMSGGQGFGSRPSSRASNEMQSSSHEGAVSSTAASSDSAESSQPASGAGDAEGGGGARVDYPQPPHQAQPSPDASALLGRGSGGVTTSSAETSSPMSSSATSRALSPSVGSSSQPAPLVKKRIMHRPRFRGDDPPAPALGSGEKFTTYPASSSRDHPRSANLPSTSGKAASPAEASRGAPGSKPTSTATSASGSGGGGGGGGAAASSVGSSGKEKKLAQSDLYDFPDSPDEDASGRTPSSYMALGIPGRSPRKGHVDSTDSSKAPSSADTSGVGSTMDERRSSSGEQGSKDGNEAQGYESYTSTSTHHHHHDARGHYATRRDSTDITSGSVVDSTHRDKPGSCSGSDDSSTIDSSTAVERKPSKRLSPRCAPDESAEGYEASESTQGRSTEGLGYGQHTRSPRARASSTEGTTGFSGADSSSSERSPMGSGSGGATSSMGMGSYPPYSSSTGSGQPVVSSMMRDPELQAVCSRDQEPAPLLSSQYETLSDDDDN